MGSESSDLVPETLGRNFGDLGQDLLINMEIVGELLVMLFEQNLSGSFDGFCSDSAHL